MSEATKKNMEQLIAVNTQHTGNRKTDHRGFAESWTSEQLDGLLSEDWLKRMVADIRAGNEALKDRLPYICPHYGAFRNNHRAQADIIPETFTFMTCVDVDEPELVEGAIKRALELNSDEYSDWQGQILRIEYSARRKVHIYIRIPKGMTIGEAQDAFCSEIGIPKANDESCTTPERFIYLTGRDEEVYRSEHWLEALSDEEVAERREAYLQRGLDVDGRKLRASPSPSEGEASPSPSEGGDVVKSVKVYPSEYHGIAFSEILKRYWELNNDGYEPTEGDRDTLTFQLARDLRHICGKSFEWPLLRRIPAGGETAENQECAGVEV